MYSVIIPSRNATNLLACGQAIRDSGSRAHLIIIDDGLPASLFEESGACDILRPFVLIPGISPFIFARNVNLGIRCVLRNDVILMNDDALIRTRGGLEILEASGHVFSQFGIVAASVDNCGSPGQVHRSPEGLQREGLPEGLREEPTMLAFICVFIPRRVISKVGLLDERFGLAAEGAGPRGYGCEDDDYCLRVKQAGYTLGVHNSVVVHHQSEATGLQSTFRHGDRPSDVRMHERLFREKHGHWPEGHGYPTR